MNGAPSSRPGKRVVYRNDALTEYCCTVRCLTLWRGVAERQRSKKRKPTFIQRGYLVKWAWQILEVFLRIVLFLGGGRNWVKIIICQGPGKVLVTSIITRGSDQQKPKNLKTAFGSSVQFSSVQFSSVQFTSPRTTFDEPRPPILSI